MTTLAMLILPLLLSVLGGAMVLAVGVTLRRRQVAHLVADLGLENTGLLRWQGVVDGADFLLLNPMFGGARMAWRCPQPLALRRADRVLDLAEPGVPTGDAAFDHVVRVVGEPARVVATLTPALRDQLRPLFDAHGGLQVAPSGLSVHCAADAVQPSFACLRHLRGLLDAHQVPALPDRFAAETVPQARARLLTFHDDEALRSLARDDPHPAVRAALGLADTDVDTLLPLVLGDDIEAAERSFLALRAEHPEALRDALLDHCFATEPHPRQLRQLSSIRDPQLARLLRERIEQLPADRRPDAVSWALPLVAHATCPPGDLVQLARVALQSRPHLSTWDHALRLLRAHGTPDDLGGLPPAPTASLGAQLERVARHLSSSSVTRQLESDWGLRPAGDGWRARVDGYTVAVLLEAERAVVRIEGLSRLATAFDSRTQPVPIPSAERTPLVWDRATRLVAAELTRTGRLDVGQREGVVLWVGAELTAEVAHAVHALAGRLEEPDAPDDVLRRNLSEETHPDWLAAWVRVACARAWSPEGMPDHRDHPDVGVSLASARWHADADRLLVHLCDQAVEPALREQAAHDLVALDARLSDALAAAPRFVLPALLAAPRPDRTALAVAWLVGAPDDHRDAVLALALAAPHPDALPLLHAALGRDPLPVALPDALAAVGTQQTLRGLRARRASVPPGKAHDALLRAERALHERLGGAGAVSIAQLEGGELSVASGHGGLSEPEP